MKKILLFLFPLYLFASAGGSGEYDIVPRLINFIIFVAILYYFIASPLKNFFKSRKDKISNRLDEIQKKLNESKAKKFETMKKLEDTRLSSVNAIATAKQEAELLAQKIKDDAKKELVLFEKHFEEQKEYELRKMQKEVVSQVLTELFNDKEVALKQNEVIDIITKKVS
ncbi:MULTISPECIES: F0F1 ATP synthase subunit B [unclassified Campylobacter]|uniref:F0F1 ATP synthase subunit B n=1 Tax=unclassified Campylobacter TaxID=2593542 RepID=UPI001237B94B|nr:MULTISPECIES: F0F1 ATP synthase subunit B [unclassified Campylobacter]KAA6227321.1 F0F1 ATP synthase subunit B [Campylobacter sp. LR286c]KAA6227804.1 F0F1 ATP synthase subunit B [Campylobacter sp. LR185c]KAA6228212.1 F0F1 ATP synthase subunit B [Campylobacter sp. LR196d]KAA6229212.1 F0F1 ATP synthase subunit B [Campylobacter sp. LR291e]KAA6231017.1 F0F1 ATP synthase subunit B [Campylobacter sp. LR264d]